MGRIFTKFGAGGFYKNLSRKCEFRENWLSDIPTSREVVNVLLPYFPHLLNDLGETIFTNVIKEFREKRCSYSRKGMNDFLCFFKFFFRCA